MYIKTHTHNNPVAAIYKHKHYCIVFYNYFDIYLNKEDKKTNKKKIVLKNMFHFTMLNILNLIFKSVPKFSGIRVFHDIYSLSVL